MNEPQCPSDPPLQSDAVDAHRSPRTQHSADESADPRPDPPHELDADPDERRQFIFDDIEWIAWVSGKAAGGTGGYGLGMMDAVHFARLDEPGRPRYEALLARGRFRHLFDEELCVLLRGAVRIILPDTEQTGERR